MSDKSATNDLPQTGGADLNVTVGQNVIDSFRWKFASSGKKQREDFPKIGHLDQERLWATYTRAREANSGLKNAASHFGVRRFFKALEYEPIKTSCQVIHSRYRTCTFVLLLYVSGLILSSAPIDVAIGAIDRVEVEATLSEVTGEGPFTYGLHGQHASLPDMFTNRSHTVLVDVDDSADRGEMFSPFPLLPRA
ncbi:hypothetical protein F5888DRAFT_1718747 [Russula emetica]|nr:hypothetical protein F5888DRAFT_1718747 [Russula emetica]